MTSREDSANNRLDRKDNSQDVGRFPPDRLPALAVVFSNLLRVYDLCSRATMGRELQFR